MCTVTIVPSAAGVRLVCNRDERRTRPPALPPELRQVGPRTAAFPVDPVGGGTWVGVNDAGLVLTLLNRTSVPDDASAPAKARSRGSIVRALLAEDSLSAVISGAGRLDAAMYEPFELVVTDGRAVGRVASDGAGLRMVTSPLDSPRLFTSSGLGDALVESPRRELFERMVARDSRRALEGQRRFHRHRWRGRPHISVSMDRLDATTVSRTRVDLLTGGRWRLRYDALDGTAPRSVTWSPSR